VARASTFTSYINAELPSNIDATWKRYEQIATRTYSNISQQAERASRAASGLMGGRGTGGASGSMAGQRQAATMRAIDEVNRKVERSTAGVTRSMSQQGRQMQQTAGSAQTLSRGLSAVSTSLNIVQGPLGPLAGRVSAVSRAVSDLTGFRLGLASVASSLFVIGSVGNQYAQIEGRLRGFYDSQEQVNRAMGDIAGIAQRARTSLDPIADMYVKLSQSAEQFGISQERAARLVETATKAAALSGGTRQSQEAALYQFGQGFASNRLGGEELRSILENANVLAIALANGMTKLQGGVRVTVGDLRTLAAEGKLTAETIANALDASAIEIDARFARMPKTISQGLTELRNNFTLMVGELNQTVGFTEKVAGALSALAGSLRFVGAAAVGVGVAFAAVKIASLVGDTVRATRQFMVMSSAMRTLTQRRLADAEAAQASAQRSIAALNQQQAEIRETIALEERRRRLATEDLRRVRGDPGATSAAVKLAIREEIAAMQALNAARRNGKITADALTAAEQRLAVASQRVAAAQQAAAARSNVFRSAVSSLIGAINPLGIAIGIATTALIMLATKADAAEETLREFGAEAVTAARRAIGLAEANSTLAQSFYDVARAQGRLAVTEAREKRGEVAGQYADRLRTLAVRLMSEQGRTPDQQVRSRLGQDSERLLQWADALERGTANVRRLNTELTQLQRTTPQIFTGRGNILGFEVGRDLSPSGLQDSAAALTIRNEALRQALEDQQTIEREIEQSRSRVAQAGPQAGPVAIAGLRTQAQADALDAGTSAIRAAGIRRRDALRQLDEEMGVSQGRVPGARAEEYRARAAEIERSYNMEVEGARSAARARTSAARSNAQAARQEIRDNRELAASRRDAALLDLQQRQPQMGQQEFYAARQAILRTYDEEIERIDAAGAASNSAVQQMIRDAREMQRLAQTMGERRRDILGGWEDQPSSIRKARDQIEDLNRMVGSLVDGIEAVSEANPLGTGLYTQDMADGDAARIYEGVRRPLEQAAEEAQKFREVAELRLGGYDLLADALERALSLQEQIGRLSREDFENVVNQTEEQQRINALLAQRERLLEPILNQVERTRDAFEEMLLELPNKGLKAGGDFIKSLGRQVQQVWARRITEQLFGNAEQKVRELVGGSRAGVDAAYEFLAKHAKDSGAELDRVASASTGAANALDDLALAASNAAAGVAGGGGVGGTAENAAAAATNIGGAIAAAVGGASSAGDANYDDNVIVVTAPRPQTTVTSTTAPRATAGIKAIGDEFGSALNSVFGTKFFSKMGDVFAGAGMGTAASGLLGGITGLKQSSTGAAIGGAIGSLIPIPGGSIIGGLIGGTIGGLFKKTKSASATIGAGGTSISGNSSEYRKVAGELAGSVNDQLNQIADAIGAEVNLALGSVSIGVRKGDYRVDPTGRGQTKTKKGAIDFGDDQQAAIAYAVKNLIQDGVLTGISAASQRILRSGQDLQKAIEKVIAIESIPRRLKALKDPVGFAIDELNREFAQLISYLKEGGATAEQFAQAQELYDLERIEAMKTATQDMVSAIDDYLQDMISGSSSPLNKRTVYNNAEAELAKFTADINAGKVVDQQELLQAASNFQNASRELFGSSQDFFADFDELYALLEKAKANALASTPGTTPGNLPPSPFETDPTVKALLDQYKGLAPAIDTQTDALTDELRAIRDAIMAGGGANYWQASAIYGLPGFQDAYTLRSY
jgi:tape measure domain-containing protein